MKLTTEQKQALHELIDLCADNDIDIEFVNFRNFIEIEMDVYKGEIK